MKGREKVKLHHRRGFGLHRGSRNGQKDDVPCGCRMRGHQGGMN